jgi:multimeric flavodoxin WrbA
MALGYLAVANSQGECIMASKNILGLVGSPRRLGNCEIFIKEVSRNLHVEHELQLIRMPSLTILPCQGCYRCILDLRCPHDDDMDFLLSQVASADAIIMATPVYFLGANSIFKAILDRGFLFYPHLRQTFGKPCVLASIFGVEERVGTASQTLFTLASWLGLNIKAHAYLKASIPGEILSIKRNRDIMQASALRLFGDSEKRQPYGCPYCGCDIIRMTRNKLICTNCHGSFTYDGTKRTKMETGEIFGSPDYMLLHKQWLQGMKQAFLKKKRETIRTLLPYQNMGQWLTK